MSQLKINQLLEMEVEQIAVTCQLLQETPYIIADLKGSTSAPQISYLRERVFTPFQGDITGICTGRKAFIGEFSGYICWYQQNYIESKPGITMEDIALTHTDHRLFDFTDSIMRDNGQIHKQWAYGI